MKHLSTPVQGAEVEIVELTPTDISPLISKCQIKVCYVSDKPNRNKSIITKETAKKLAPSLRGAAIVGYYNEETQDFEEHNRELEVEDGKLVLKDATRPYGFVDLAANVWFQKFLDDNEVEREYLMTEGYLWTGQYPEAQRVIEKGNNQSMELNQDSLNAYWTKDNNGKPQFFIINEAILEKLCILGEDCEPCFEGATISDVQFSLGDNFKQELFSMMNELKEILKKGGARMLTTYAVDMGDTLFCRIMDYLVEKYPDTERWGSYFRPVGVYEEAEEKFAIVQCKDTLKYFKLSFVYNDAEGFIPAEELEEVTQTFVAPESPQFSLEDLEEFENKYKKEEENKDEDDKSDEDNSEEEVEVEEDSEEEKEEEEEKKKYSLEEIPEYVELVSKYSDLESKYNDLIAEKEQIESQLQTLQQFKLDVERERKRNMIDNTFYMLSDEDKSDVINNIDTYSLEEIESKLSVICVRNRVSFATLDDDENNQEPLTYNLGASMLDGDEGVPAWIKAVLDTQKNIQNN